MSFSSDHMKSEERAREENVQELILELMTSTQHQNIVSHVEVYVECNERENDRQLL